MNLEIRDDGAGPRHYLDGRPVHCGTQLRLLIPVPGCKESWVWARYEANFCQDGILVILFTAFGRVHPDETTILRWPKEEE